MTSFFDYLLFFFIVCKRRNVGGKRFRTDAEGKHE